MEGKRDTASAHTDENIKVSFRDTVELLFSARMLSIEECQKMIVSKYYGIDKTCTVCGQSITGEKPLKKIATLTGRVYCSKCGNQPHATKGTILEGGTLDARQVVLLALLQSLDVDTQRISRMVGVSADTVRYWRDRIEVI